MYNLTGDCIILVAHFFFGIFMLTMIELEVHAYFRWFPGFGFRRSSDNNVQNGGKKQELDEDVIAEERRVEAQQHDRENQDCIRVCNFQKEYDQFCSAPV